MQVTTEVQREAVIGLDATEQVFLLRGPVEPEPRMVGQQQTGIVSVDPGVTVPTAGGEELPGVQCESALEVTALELEEGGIESQDAEEATLLLDGGTEIAGKQARTDCRNARVGALPDRLLLPPGTVVRKGGADGAPGRRTRVVPEDLLDAWGAAPCV